ncbi:MAG: GspH/FimT family pseudopilin [Pseudohongiellaceae bacterium]
MDKNRGFTLIELMITVALVAILAAVAAPGMSSFIENAQIKAEAQRLASLLSLARNQAITDNLPMVVSGSFSGNALNIDVYSNSGDDATLTFEAGDTYIERSTGSQTQLDIGSNAVVSDDNIILFDSDGRLDETGVAIVTFCNEANTSGRQVSVNIIGRVSLSELDNPASECL